MSHSTGNQNKLKFLKIKFKKLMKPRYNKTEPKNETNSSASSLPKLNLCLYTPSSTTPMSTAKDNPSESLSAWDHIDVFETYTQSRTYKLLSTNEISLKTMPRYYFTNQEHFIMHQAWNIFCKMNENQLFMEFKQILCNDGELKRILCRNRVDIKE
eukprot:249162_1